MRVLIVDDNEALRQMLCIALDPIAPKPGDKIVAKDGLEAVEKAKKHQPDIVLMDVMMPPGLYGGFTALEHLKADESTARIPVVLMSVLTNAQYAERALELGADGFLQKPFDLLGLPKRLEGYVAKKKARDGPGPPTTKAPNSAKKGA